MICRALSLCVVVCEMMMILYMPSCVDNSPNFLRLEPCNFVDWLDIGTVGGTFNQDKHDVANVTNVLKRCFFYISITDVIV